MYKNRPLSSRRYINNSGEKMPNQMSDVKKYAQFEANEDNILKKVQPVPNLNGVMVVEVQKVIKDL